MSTPTLSFERATEAPAAADGALQRSRGRIDLRVERRATRSVVTDLHQGGAYRLRLPRPSAGEDPEAVLINTAGGMTGGDAFRLDAHVGPGAAACVTGQACEKIYRSAGGEAEVDVALRVAAGGEFAWLPQPAILFEGAALTRRLTLDLAADARVVALEATILGRDAMGERVTRCRLRDHWRIRVDGRLRWANEMRIDAPELEGGHPSTLDGGRAMATLVMVDPEAEARLDEVRGLLEAAGGRGGASAFDGMLVAMHVAADADALMEDLRRLVECVRGRPIPRVWTC
ncbi:MAG TPA: urease accessory protein UreD [Pseudomonadales bacterium]|nr:urease accessory protein UreD [Pseudomonadales bacterium]